MKRLGDDRKDGAIGAGMGQERLERHRQDGERQADQRRRCEVEQHDDGHGQERQPRHQKLAEAHIGDDGGDGGHGPGQAIGARDVAGRPDEPGAHRGSRRGRR